MTPGLPRRRGRDRAGHAGLARGARRCCAASARTSRDRCRSPMRRCCPPTSGGAPPRACAGRWPRRSEAMSAAGFAAGEVATVFATSGSDGETLHRICEALAGAGARSIADALSQFRAQRRGRLLDHRGGLAPAVGERVRLRRLVCGVGLVEAASQVRGGRRAGAARGVRSAVSRAAATPCARSRSRSRSRCCSRRSPCPERSPACAIELAPRGGGAARPFPAALPAELATTIRRRRPAAARERGPRRSASRCGSATWTTASSSSSSRDMVLSRDAIAALIPHQGAMCLLDEVLVQRRRAASSAGR